MIGDDCKHRMESGLTLPTWQILLIVLLIALLTSCSHTKKGDGPPDFYVDETKIPNAIPKPEPLAKYGNLKSYVVFGKRYHTLASSKHYEAIGIASWYGRKFHARRTSSGERYNMLTMTAAHRTLPLPTYVEVTNLKNQRKVIVKINDRGPFARNRLIDLSYVAAKKLGMIGHGTALVKIRAISPYSYGPEPFFASKHTRGPLRFSRYAKNHTRKQLRLKHYAKDHTQKPLRFSHYAKNHTRGPLRLKHYAKNHTRGHRRYRGYV